MKEQKRIVVGNYVHIETWKPGDKLWSEWIEHDPKEVDNIIANLNPKEEILPAGKYTLAICYPLTYPFIDEKEFEKPVTREEVVSWIVESYHFIYNAEDKTSLTPAGLVPGMLNRIKTDGDFGIWGHGIEDLDLHTIYVDENNVITPGVDS